MAKLNPPRRLIREDFDPKYYELIDKLGYIFNPVIEQLVLAFNNRITVEENLNGEIKEIDVEVDGDGFPVSNIVYQSTLINKVRGMTVIRALYNDTRPEILNEITSITATSPAVVTTSDPHGFSTGDKITIEGSDSDPVVDDVYSVSVLNDNDFEIPVSVSVAGTTGTVTRAYQAYPTGSPIISFVENQKVVNINHIAGLPPNRKFRLTVLIIGTLN